MVAEQASESCLFFLALLSAVLSCAFLFSSVQMFATIRQTQALLSSFQPTMLISGPNDFPPGAGPYGDAVAQGDLWGDYQPVGTGDRGALCAPEADPANM